MPTVYIGPSPEAGISAAVVRGGGSVVNDREDARAIIWLGTDPRAGLGELNERVTWVHLRQAGIDRWISAGTLDDKRQWTSSAGVFGPLVGERAVALLLAVVHRLHEHARASEWTRLQSGTVAGKTVLIVGTGGIGRSAAQYLGALGARCIGVSASGAPTEGFVEVRSISSWPAVCARADHLVLAAPFTERTRGMVARDALTALPRHATVINVGRGGVLDTTALVDALDREEIAGAGLDVTSPEPLPPEHPLWVDERVLISSHTANPCPENRVLLAARVEENVRRWSAGDPLLGLIDVRRGY